jgi:hypothetical protein
MPQHLPDKQIWHGNFSFRAKFRLKAAKPTSAAGCRATIVSRQFPVKMIYFGVAG